jgi:hypothetical protein
MFIAKSQPPSSSRSVAHHCPWADISAWLPGRVWLQSSRSSCIRTCCGTPAGSSSPTTATTLAPSSLSRPPIDHVHGPLHGLDAEPFQELLEGLNFPSVSYQTTRRPLCQLRGIHRRAVGRLGLQWSDFGRAAPQRSHFLLAAGSIPASAFAVIEVGLQRPRVMPFVCQSVAAGVSKHVRVRLEP